MHGDCIGGGVDLITAADVRFATKDATFSVKVCHKEGKLKGIKGSRCGTGSRFGNLAKITPRG